MTTRRQFMAGAVAARGGGHPRATRPARRARSQIRISTAAPPRISSPRRSSSSRAEVERANVGLNVTVHPASTLFKQGTEVPALQRGNLEMSTMTTFEVAQQMPALRLLQPRLSVPRLCASCAACSTARSARSTVGPSPTRWESRFSPHLSRHAAGEPAPEAGGKGARRPRRREDAHAGRAGLAAARPRARGQSGAARHAGGLSGAARPALSTVRKIR